MRLLNTTTKQLKSFDDEYKIPQYAILSHTWGEEEVLFNHITGSGDARRKGEKFKGYKKIEGACKQAEEDGWEYIWIDTCCINKESSAELSEAINSMYKWYQKAEVCYVYLEDVYSGVHNQKNTNKDVKTDQNDEENQPIKMVPFESSRWFSRGWTLQELLAPEYIVFYSRDWVDIGTRASLQDAISTTTGIRVEMLVAFDPRKASVAERMSWSASRTTTRKEDIAYCLMGLFGVNMPLLYGEGNKAFRRLQEEIMKVSDDHSLFAWKGDYSDYTVPDGVNLSTKNYKARGLLADSPWEFHDGVDMVTGNDGAFSPYSMTNQGLQIQLPLQPIDPERDLIDIDSDYTKDIFKATLKCTIRNKQPTRWIVIYLKVVREGYYDERVFPHLLNETETDSKQSELKSFVVPQVDTSIYHLSKYQYLYISTKILPTESGFTTGGDSLVDGYGDDILLSTHSPMAVTLFYGPEGECFTVVIGSKDNLIWLDAVDVNKEWSNPQKHEMLQLEDDIKQDYKEGGRRYDRVSQHLDRLSVRISDWSVVVSAKKFKKGVCDFHVTVDIQREPILSRGWYTPTSTSDRLSSNSLAKGSDLYGFKKEHGDWIAIYNPRTERTLDISSVHSITCHPSHFISTNGISLVQFSPDGKKLAVRYSSYSPEHCILQFYDTSTGELCILFGGESTIESVSSVCFSPDGKFLAIGFYEEKIVVWDIEKKDNHKVLEVAIQHFGHSTSLCFSFDSRLIVSGSKDGIIQIWDITDETSHTFTSDYKSNVQSVAISPDGRLVAGGGFDSGTVYIWDIAAKRLIKKLEGYNNVVFTSDGERLVVGGRHGLGLLDVGALIPSQVMEGSERDNSPRVSGMLTRENTSLRIIYKSLITSVAVSSDGHWVITGLIEGSVQFWDLEEGTVKFILQGHMGLIRSVDMSPVGNIFATSSEDSNRARIWHYDTT